MEDLCETNMCLCVLDSVPALLCSARKHTFCSSDAIVHLGMFEEMIKKRSVMFVYALTLSN